LASPFSPTRFSRKASAFKGTSLPHKETQLELPTVVRIFELLDQPDTDCPSNAAGIISCPRRSYISCMALLNNMTRRSEQHRRNEKWIFVFIFVVAVVTVCWLLL
jgi:hypothetical protein